MTQTLTLESTTQKPKIGKKLHKQIVVANGKRAWRHSQGCKKNRDTVAYLQKVVRDGLFEPDQKPNENGGLFSDMMKMEFGELNLIRLKRDTIERKREAVEKMCKRVNSCCKYSLSREFTDGSITYLGAQTCKHKLCHVCNAEKSRLIRKKWMRYIEKNEFVHRKTGEIYTRENFDWFHLTLTVPHVDGVGFRGQRFYMRQFKYIFSEMRKCDWFKRYVFGGEYGFEITKGENGLHIHIHSLLMVYKSRGNRNTLHKKILMFWNRNTVDQAGKREEFTPEQFEAIRKSNRTITDGDLLRLNPKGSTFIGLESLYKMGKRKGYKGKQKVYVNPNKLDDLIFGVMECLKYHFEPVTLDKDSGTYDPELIAEVLIEIEGQPLYAKIGNLYGVSELNITNTAKDDVEELVINADEVLHPLSGEAVESGDYRYFIAPSQTLTADSYDNYKIYRLGWGHVKYLAPQTTAIEAMEAMIQLSIAPWRNNYSKPPDRNSIFHLN